MSHLVGPPVQFPVCQHLVIEHDSLITGRSEHLLLKQLMNAFIPWIIPVGVIPRRYHLLTLFPGQNRQYPNTLVRLKNDTFQQNLKVICHPDNGASIKKVGAVNPPERKFLIRFICEKAQVELGYTPLHFNRK
ncbi:MAG: hypothetical protein SVR04_15795 [Spirochaetota bacterium]|nr:hypothetical protein [Spirochaetota bacterium]